MKYLSSVVLSAAAALPLSLSMSAFAQSAAVVATSASAPGMRMAAGEVVVRAKVVELDMANRVATLRGPNGQIWKVDVPVTVKNFDQVRVGDNLTVRYAMAVAAALERVKKSGIRERVESTTSGTAPTGGMPASASVRTVEVLAEITALNRKAGTATLRGAKRVVTVSVPASVDINQLKVGDEVRAVFVEAVVLNVEHSTPKK